MIIERHVKDWRYFRVCVNVKEVREDVEANKTSAVPRKLGIS
jgi:hypothetical protein